MLAITPKMSYWTSDMSYSMVARRITCIVLQSMIKFIIELYLFHHIIISRLLAFVVIELKRTFTFCWGCWQTLTVIAKSNLISIKHSRNGFTIFLPEFIGNHSCDWIYSTTIKTKCISDFEYKPKCPESYKVIKVLKDDRWFAKMLRPQP